jgi:hypothetical protein
MRASRRQQSPKRLWDFCGEWVSAIRRLTAHDLPSLDGRVPAEIITGNTPDISEYVEFDWYADVWYNDPAVQWPDDRRRLGKWIGVAHDVGQAMTYWILPESCKPIARSTVWNLTDEERNSPVIQRLMQDLEEKIVLKIGNTVKDEEMESGLQDLFPEVPDDIYWDEFGDVTTPGDSTVREADDYDYDAYDEYLTAEVLLPNGGEITKATVIARKRDRDGNPVGKRHENPLLDTREYEVEFPDGSSDVFTANLIAENMFSQVDAEGNSFSVMSEIIDHRKNGHAVSKDDGFVEMPNGTRKPRRTTQGWDLLVQWKDGTSDWTPLKDLKESNPVETAEYAVANKLVEEPAFQWWVRPVLRKRHRIIKKVKSSYWRKTHKYGIRLPKTVDQALSIDAETGTEFWRKAIEKEMKNVSPAFEFKEDDVMPIGYQHIDCHMIFDVKMTLDRKARYVAGGHQTAPAKDMTFASVVSRDSVRIAFLTAALNDLRVLGADVQSAYINAPTTERVYTTAGKEFGSNAGRPVLIVRALYGLKSSSARWRDHMAATLRDFGYVACKADPDVWMRPRTKPDGFKYWGYLLCYTDDILVVDHDPQEAIDFLMTRYTLKEGSVAEPETYLGAQVKKYYLDGSDDPSKVRWAMSSEAYVKQAVADVEMELSKVDQVLPTRVTTPTTPKYRPEIDQSRELNADRGQYYQSLIGVLRWVCELGRIDIMVAVSMLSRYVVSPREGHLQQLFHIFAYLKHYKRSTMVFDDTYPVYDPRRFRNVDWSEFYPEAEEALPHNLPEERGNVVMTTCFVDADHAGCLATRRSHTGVILFVNKAPIQWYSKRQNTVETSTFGSEFVAMKTAIDLIEGLRYKLRMMGIPIDGATSVFCDNAAVVLNSTAPESVLKKRHNAVSYHRTREACAADIIQIAHEGGDTNIADLLSKLMAGPRLRELLGYVLW